MEGSLGRLVFVSAMGGLSTTAIIGAINAGAGAADKGEISLWAAGFFVIALLLFIQTQHFILITTTAEIGAIIHKMRVRLLDYVRRSELLPLETIGRAEIVSAITGDTAILTQASNMLAFAVQGALLITLVTIYVAYLSFTAFVLSVVIVGTGAAIFHSKTKQHAAEMREAAGWENKLYDRLSDVLDGFKEVRLNRARSDALFDHLVDVSRTAANIKIRTQSETYRRMVLLQTSLYILLGSVAFVVPLFSMAPGSITKAVTALVFIVGACSGLVQSIPIIAAANAAADRLAQLEVKLAGITSLSDEIPAEPAKKFTKIEVRDVEFHYPGKIGGHDVQGRAVQFHAQLRRPRHPDRRQRLGQIDVHEDSRRLLPAGGGRTAARRRAGGRRAIRILPQPDHRDLSGLPPVPAALWHRPIRTRPSSSPCSPSSSCRTRRASAMASSRPPTCRADSAGGLR